MNDAKTNAAGISWIQFNDIKIVNVNIALTVNASDKLPCGQIPASLAPSIGDGLTVHSASGFGSGDNANQVEIDNKGQLWSNGSGFTTWSTVYFHVDQ